jgi:hypothetical protein
LADAPQLSQVSQELSLCAVGAKDNGFDLVNVLIELAYSGISIEPTDITGAFVHQSLTMDRGVMSGDPVTLPFVLSSSASSTVSGDLLEVSLAFNDLLDASVQSGGLSGLSGDLSDSYHASGLEPCIYAPSQIVRDLVESDEVSDLSALMSDDLEDTNTRTDITKLLCAELDLSMPYSLECLKHPDLWIGDTSAGMHTNRYKTHGFNFRAGSSSVGATESAVEAECSMDIRGQFVNCDGSLDGIVATLTHVGFSKRHNFNLLSVTTLLPRLQVFWQVYGLNLAKNLGYL